MVSPSYLRPLTLLSKVLKRRPLYGQNLVVLKAVSSKKQPKTHTWLIPGGLRLLISKSLLNVKEPHLSHHYAVLQCGADAWLWHYKTGGVDGVAKKGERFWDE